MKYSTIFSYTIGLAGFAHAAPLSARQDGTVCTAKSLCPTGQACYMAPGATVGRCEGQMTILPIDVDDDTTAAEKRELPPTCFDNSDCAEGEWCRPGGQMTMSRCAPNFSKRSIETPQKRGTWLNRCDDDSDCASNQRCRASLFHLPRCRVDWLGLREDEDETAEKRSIETPQKRDLAFDFRYCTAESDCEEGEWCPSAGPMTLRTCKPMPWANKRSLETPQKRGTWLNRCDDDSDCASNQRCRASLFHLPRCRVDWLGLREDEDASSSSPEKRQFGCTSDSQCAQGQRCSLPQGLTPFGTCYTPILDTEKRVPPPEMLEEIEGNTSH